MAKRIWTEEQTQFLLKNYENMKTNEILSVLKDKTNDQIRWKAKEFKLCKNVTKSKKDITWLEDLNNNDSLYWWGFIVADGCITKRQLIISISDKDQDHLSIFANKINSSICYSDRINKWNPNGNRLVRVAVDDKRTITRLRDRFSIVDKKTYNPLNLSEFLTGNRLKYFLCGLIDGDGHIDKTNKNIRIKMHFSWLDNLKLISEFLASEYEIKSSTRINKQGWAVIQITTAGSKKLKRLVLDNVPYLKRKWDRIIL